MNLLLKGLRERAFPPSFPPSLQQKQVSNKFHHLIDITCDDIENPLEKFNTKFVSIPSRDGVRVNSFLHYRYFTRMQEDNSERHSRLELEKAQTGLVEKRWRRVLHSGSYRCNRAQRLPNEDAYSPSGA